MTHHNEEQHQRHQKERDHEKKLEKERDEKEMSQPYTLHPAWFVALGILLIGGVLFVWIFVW